MRIVANKLITLDYFSFKKKKENMFGKKHSVKYQIVLRIIAFTD